MSVFLVFMRKEWMEYTRSMKLFVLAVVFAALGFLNPVTAEYLPQLTQSLLPEGILVTLPEPTAADSWAQFFKNVPQIGMIVFLIVFSGIFASEFSRGTLINLFTKGLSRQKTGAAKWCFTMLCWSGCYWLSFGITYFYNFLFWEKSAVVHLGSAAAFVWVYGIFLLTFLLLGSVVFQSSAGGLLCAGAVFGAGMICSLFPELKKISPGRLLDAAALLENSAAPRDFLPALVLVSLLTAAGAAGSIVLMGNRKL